MRYFLLTLSLGSVYAQLYPTLGQEQFPPGYSWKVLEGEHYLLIFPEGFRSFAEYSLNLLENYHEALRDSYSSDFPKIPVVLNHTAAVGNGFVSLAPWRSYFYLFPTSEFSLSGSEWLELLALHEARHMVQYGAIRQSFYRLGYILAGDQGLGALSLFSLPSWYFEGDAVVYETLLTRGGRGRNPRFGRQTRALLLANYEPSYSQFFLRSYDYHYPDHYELGYLLMRYLKTKYGDKAIREVIRYTSQFPHPWRFSGGLSYVTGKDIDEFYQEAFSYYRDLWRRQQENLKPTSFSVIFEPTHFLTDCDHPQYDAYDKLYCVRSGYDHLSEVLQFSSEREPTILARPGILYDDFVFITPQGEVLYAEYRYHPRFGQLSTAYANFRNKYPFLQDGEITRLTVSDDEKYVAALVTTRERTQKIQIFEISSQRLFAEIEHSQSQIQMQRFSRKSYFLDYIVINRDGRALWQFSLIDLQKKELVAASSYPIADPHGDERDVYFSANYDGLEGIYKINRSTKKIYQVISHPLGAFRPSLNASTEKLAFNYYTPYGHGVGEVILHKLSPTPLEKVINREDGLADFAEKDFANLKLKSSYRQLSEKNYSPWRSLVNVHSWAPMADVNNRDLKFMVRSDSPLHDVGWSATYTYNQNERTHFGELALNYSALWPQLTLSGGYGNRALRFVEDNTQKFYRWQEQSWGFISKLPFRYLFGHYLSQLEILGQIEQRQLFNILPHDFGTKDYFKNTRVYPLSLELSCALKRRMARREIQPRWGAELRGLLRKDVASSLYEQRATSLTIYLPGIFTNHGISLEGSHDEQKNVYFPAASRFARGYAALLAPSVSILSLNYIFPLFYPDLNVLHLLFVRRFKWNFFYDRAYLNEKDIYESAGGELTMDFVPFKLNVFEVDLGVRYSYLFRLKSESYDIFLRAIRPAF
ncbi:MAG: hypothetical protein NZM25_06470 [Leptospiraceae bacterium]|nr:hypothetical protein [Leptospiraceae bacterium]MDW8306580.1 hypothetical protein [Leptospiraceae bacterium]